MPEPELNMRVEADVSGFTTAMEGLERSAKRVGSAVGAAFKSAAVDGKAFGDVLRELALRLASIVLDSALAPLERGVSDLVSGLAGALAGASAPAAAPVAARAAAPPVTFNVSTPDAQSFRRAEGQIAAMVTRSALRGRRSL